MPTSAYANQLSARPKSPAICVTTKTKTRSKNSSSIVTGAPDDGASNWRNPTVFTVQSSHLGRAIDGCGLQLGHLVTIARRVSGRKEFGETHLAPLKYIAVTPRPVTEMAPQHRNAREGEWGIPLWRAMPFSERLHHGNYW